MRAVPCPSPIVSQEFSFVPFTLLHVSTNSVSFRIHSSTLPRDSVSFRFASGTYLNRFENGPHRTAQTSIGSANGFRRTAKTSMDSVGQPRPDNRAQRPDRPRPGPSTASHSQLQLYIQGCIQNETSQVPAPGSGSFRFVPFRARIRFA